MTDFTRNFSAGPGALPRSVLVEAQEAVLALPGTGISILGLSHRSRQFRDILDEAEQRLRTLLGIPPGYRVLFLQGGGSLQFSMVPLAMLPADGVADYVVTGYWSRKAIETARKHGNVHMAWDGSHCGFSRVPEASELSVSPQAAYLHYVSNETVDGLQFRSALQSNAPLVCDMSSDLLSRPLDVRPFSLVYAHAQKNLGPAGVTVVLVSDEVLAGIPAGLPPTLDYRAHAEARSLLHTPTVFSIYVVLLVLRWLENEIGGIEQMGRINSEKARIVRSALAENAPFYQHDVQPGSESDMNVTFRCPSRELDALFTVKAEQAGLVGTAGHRSRGGLRVSLYNGVTMQDASVLSAFLRDFAHSHRLQGDPAA